MVFANNGRRPGVRVMRDIMQSYFGTGMLYANPPPDQGNDEAPCEESGTVFPSLKARSARATCLGSPKRTGNWAVAAGFRRLDGLR